VTKPETDLIITKIATSNYPYMVTPFRKMAEAGIDESVSRYTVACTGEKERFHKVRKIQETP